MALDLFFNRIESQYVNALPFVVYRKPNEGDVKALLQKNSNLYFTENFAECGFVFTPFDRTKDSVLIPIGNSESISIPFEESSIETSQAEKCTDIDSKGHHISLVNKGVEAIKNNEFKKVVLSRQEKIDLSKDANPISIFKRLLSTYKSAFVYCWYHPKVGLWLGATPETLIKIEGKQFSIMALAGTQNYKGTLDVIWKEKEKEEQHIVTDFIIESIKPLVESTNASQTETVKAGNLLHLKTMISAQLYAKSNLQDIIEVLHPTPAVCGFPKIAAKHFILENEGYNREFYTGFLGELNLSTVRAPRSGKRNIENRAYAFHKKSTQLYVNLRCMQLKDDQAIIYVGGGITESSDAEKEWEETISKSLIIKSIL